jgi:molecular chaperone GrpE
MTEKKTKPHEESKPQQKQTEEQEVQTPGEESKALREQFEAVQKERDDLLGRLQRVSADYANFQKRQTRQINDSVQYEKEKILRSFLPVLDNFEHTLKAHTTGDVSALIKAIEIIYGQMLDTLRLHGVEQIGALGQVFDPDRHQAVMRMDVPDKPADIVLEELQKGYIAGGHVIRPSRVVVNKVQTPPGTAKPDGQLSQEQPGHANVCVRL